MPKPTKKKLPSQLSSKEVLLTLAKMAGYTALALIPKSNVNIYSMKPEVTDWAWQHFKRELYYLKRRGYLKIGQSKSLTLTAEGLARINKITPATKIKLAMGRYIMVIFDVPEKYKHGRDNLRYFLKDNDFVQLQESVWVSNYDISEEITEYVKTCDISEWINVVIVEKLAFLPKRYEKSLANLNL